MLLTHLATNINKTAEKKKFFFIKSAFPEKRKNKRTGSKQRRREAQQLPSYYLTPKHNVPERYVIPIYNFFFNQTNYFFFANANVCMVGLSIPGSVCFS
jgi:hypothetical protein